tara:strand:+ start:3268 stop:4749 length:1482 start_codon:yes stop_codon:yes gene_type:complete
MSRQKFAKFDPEYGDEDLEEIIEIYTKIFLDPAFQRMGGFENGSGWDIKAFRKYIKKKTTGMTGNDILLVDCAEALHYAKRQGCQLSVAYYTNVLNMSIERRLNDKVYNTAQAEFVIVDGNNTSSCIYWYFKDAFKARVFGSKKLRLYSELTKKEQRKYLRRTFGSVIRLRRILRPEISDLFYDLNQSTKLNDQESRQCTFGDLSDYCRDIANQYKEAFTTTVFRKPDHLDKRCHEETFAAFVLYEDGNHTTSVKKAQLDEFYENQQFAQGNTQKLCTSILKELHTMLKDRSFTRAQSKGKLHIFWRVISLLKKGSYDIVDHDALGEAITTHLVRNTAAYAKRAFTNEGRPYGDWSHWVKFWNREAEAARLDAYYINWVGLNIAAWMNDGIIKHRRTAKDSFTWAQKLELYVAQRGLDRFGKKLSSYDLWEGRLEADHLIPVAAGGETAHSNGEVGSVSYNRSKGATAAAAVFPHQDGYALPGDEEADEAITS